MSGNMELIVKSETGMHAFCKGLVARDIAYPHAEFDTKVLAPYARNRHPQLHVGNAIAKVLAEETPVARPIVRAFRLSSCSLCGHQGCGRRR